MIQKALEYIVGLKNADIHDIDGEKYSDKPLNRIINIQYADQIEFSTLTSLVDYIKSGVDAMKEKMIIHVTGPETVKLYSNLDGKRNREYIAIIKASVPSFSFGQFMEHESFCIALQSKFIGNEDRSLVLRFAGTVEDGTVAQYGDDGITQKATVKTGIASKSDAVVPNPVFLTPFRTFNEIEQPSSNFIFRMQSDRGIKCAIFEADGGAWKNEATQRIKEYLQTNLVEYPQFTIIS